MNTPWQVPSTRDASPAFFPVCNRPLSTSAWSAMRSSTSLTLWSWKTRRISTTFPPTALHRSDIRRNLRGKGTPWKRLPSPSRNRQSMPSQDEPSIANRLLRRSRVTITMGCGVGGGVADAVESAFQNRSLPVQEPKRRGRLHALIRSEAIVRNETIVPNEASALNANAQAGLNVHNNRGGRKDTTDQNDPSGPNTGRRPDTSPSFCRESPYPNISAWRRPDPRRRVRVRVNEQWFQHQISPHRRSRRFSPEMNRYSRSLLSGSLRPTGNR